jgi:hypothetical protein
VPQSRQLSTVDHIAGLAKSPERPHPLAQQWLRKAPESTNPNEAIRSRQTGLRRCLRSTPQPQLPRSPPSKEAPNRLVFPIDVSEVFRWKTGEAYCGKHRQAAKATRKGLIEKYTYGGAAIMRLISWQRLGIIASVVWVVVGPSYFHLSREDDDKRIAGDRYQLCIKQGWARKGDVERCNKEFRQALAIAHWSSWAQLAFTPVVLAWFVGWGVLFLRRRVRSRPQAGSEHPQIVDAEDNGEQHGKEDYFPAPWTVQTADGGFKVVDSATPKSAAETAKGLTMDEARHIAANIAKLPSLLGKGD